MAKADYINDYLVRRLSKVAAFFKGIFAELNRASTRFAARVKKNFKQDVA
jgi:hypothetical protein